MADHLVGLGLVHHAMSTYHDPNGHEYARWRWAMSFALKELRDVQWSQITAPVNDQAYQFDARPLFVVEPANEAKGPKPWDHPPAA